MVVEWENVTYQLRESSADCKANPGGLARPKRPLRKAGRQEEEKQATLFPAFLLSLALALLTAVGYHAALPCAREEGHTDEGRRA
jgi:hypothetical protein